mmetsp:Transcript_113054/g.300357  ORF Transcript_113054/g.300357 Transcript_113054/m.300357 type:complete len:173 (+) Transcript_113054:217-735(+)
MPALASKELSFPLLVEAVAFDAEDDPVPSEYSATVPARVATYSRGQLSRGWSGVLLAAEDCCGPRNPHFGIRPSWRSMDPSLTRVQALMLTGLGAAAVPPPKLRPLGVPLGGEDVRGCDGVRRTAPVSRTWWPSVAECSGGNRNTCVVPLAEETATSWPLSDTEMSLITAGV